MRILVLAFHYPPDLSAGSFRMAGLIPALLERLPAEAQLEVIAASPSRYGSFQPNAENEVEEKGVRVHRVPVPPVSGGPRSQARAFLAYARGVGRLTAGNRYGLVFATSSRLMTACLGALVAQRTRSPLFLDIRDVFPEGIRDVISPPLGPLLAHVFSGLERLAVHRSVHVNLVSEGHLPYFEERFPNRRFSVIPNGVDGAFLAENWSVMATREAASVGPLRVVYAGNIGEGQGLHRIIPRLARALEGRAEFRIIGDGGRKAELVHELTVMGVGNVELIPPVPRDRLVEEYRHADVLFLHLNDHAAFERVLPSKVFEYAATGRSIWAGVSGFAAEFLSREVENAHVFDPVDQEGALRAFERLKPEYTPRLEFKERFSRERTSSDLAEEMVRWMGNQR